MGVWTVISLGGRKARRVWYGDKGDWSLKM